MHLLLLISQSFARFSIGIIISQFAFFSFAGSPTFQLAWPTPNSAFAKGMGYSTFLQKTGPEKPITSGAFGCVRNNGYKFHEGLDLYPVKRDKKGKAEDSIFAVMDGTVSYVNATPGYSAYGKYIVLEHINLTPSLYSLYAHLDSINPRIKIGSKVRIAQILGQMGNSSSGYRIPLNRSHLHFEIGLRLTNKFQNWYSKKPFSSKNRHGNFSGFNLVGIDPILFYSKYKQKSFSTPLDFLKSLPSSVTARIRTTKTPDFALRYPSLIKNQQSSSITGWDVAFGPYGIPLQLTAFDKPIPANKKEIQILKFDADSQAKPCRRLIIKKGNELFPTEQLKTYLELIFDL